MSCEPSEKKLSTRVLWGGCCICILASQLFFGILQWFAFEKSYLSTYFSPYGFACESLVREIENNFVMGKTLERFQGFSDMAEETLPEDDLLKATMLLRPDGTVVQWKGEAAQESLTLPQGASGSSSDLLQLNLGRYRVLIKPLMGVPLYGSLEPVEQERQPSGTQDVVGYLGVMLDASEYQATLSRLLFQSALIMSLATLGLLLLCGGILGFVRYRSAAGGGLSRWLLAAIALPLLLVQCVCAYLFFESSQAISQEAVKRTTQKNTEILAEKIQRVLNMGLRLDELRDLNTVLADMRALSPALQTVTVGAGDGTVLYSSNFSETPALKDTSEETIVSLAPDGNSFVVAAHIDWEYLSRQIGANAMDAATTFIVSLLFMAEMFLLAAAFLRKPGPAQYSIHQKGAMRGMAFWLLVALDMSISFIPLRMGELARAGGDTLPEMLLGLPVSAEMGAASLSILLVGIWIARSSAVPPLYAGILLLTLGYLGSAFSAGPMAFIVARGVCGLGYGFGILALQNVVVACSASADKGKNITALFAGVYSGSLCGSVMGAMLADRFGYSLVFALSAIMLAVLFIPAFFWARQWNISHYEDDVVKVQKVPLSMRGALKFCTDRNVLSMMLLNLFPGALVTVGLVNFFLPVFLNRSGVSQSDIGRVFMVYCLVFICCGPVIGKWIERLPGKILAVSLSGIVGSICLLIFTIPTEILSPFWLSLCSAIFLGFFISVCLTAQNSFLLNCNISHVVGHEQAMSLYNTVERLGQVVGPLVFGAALAFFSPARFALVGGGVFIFFSVLFLVMAKKEVNDAYGTSEP